MLSRQTQHHKQFKIQNSKLKTVRLVTRLQPGNASLEPLALIIRVEVEMRDALCLSS